MKIIGTVLVYAGVISLLLGWVGVAFCGFADSFMRGIRNLIVPFMGFSDAMRRYPILIRLTYGGIAAMVLGELLL